MSTLYGTRKYAIEGDNAAKVYDAVVNSFIYSNFHDTLTLEYKEGLLMIVEEWSNYPAFGDYVLPFLYNQKKAFLVFKSQSVREILVYEGVDYCIIYLCCIIALDRIFAGSIKRTHNLYPSC